MYNKRNKYNNKSVFSVNIWRKTFDTLFHSIFKSGSAGKEWADTGFKLSIEYLRID